MSEKARQYVAIDAKSFYASVECVERHLNPLTTNLVVADESRTEKTICLAVSPALKAHKVPGRPRLFEVIRRIREVNRERLKAGIRSGAIQRDPETREYRFSSASFDAEALAADPSLEVSYIVAPPRMRLYEEYSSRIYATYPTVTVEYFEADVRKDGGAYRQCSGEVKKIDLFERTIVFVEENCRSGGKTIPMDDVVDIRGEALEALEDACEGDDAF